ncbi:MAG: hypothetical protein C4524_03095 [Candidatus Zixiibacteriota bacterium]|nr:MAG: hypothetical protein C4524_03095 [candidate division Zixibacteria bacterium]
MKLLILALDGFDPDLFARWRDRLPHLDRLARQGCWRPAASTVPPMTFPAWSTFLTGVDPGRHGIFDFTERLPGRLGVRFVNASRRSSPTFLRLASAAGWKVGSIGLPTTYPPEPLSGYQISGFDTPLPSKAEARYVHPRALAERLERELGGYYFGDFNESRIGRGWHRRVLGKLLEGMQRKTELVRFLQQEYPVDLLLLHVGETDTAGHHFWAFHDPDSPRHVAATDSELRDALFTVYRAADALAGEIFAQTQPETVLVISDHGMGGTSDRVLYLNRYLAECGLLRFAPHRAWTPWVGRVKIFGMRWLPYRMQQEVFRVAGGRLASGLESRQRFGGLDWAGTVAYSEELNYFPALWLNRRDREPFGTVAADRVEAATEQVIQALLAWKDPQDGSPVVRRVRRREEVYRGPETGSAPDLILELNRPQGYSYALGRSTSAEGRRSVRRLEPREYLGFKGGTMNGSHRPYGTFILHSGRPHPPLPDDVSLVDMAPLVLNFLGMEIPAWMRPDGGEISAAAPGIAPSAATELSRREEAALRRRLTDMGYLG